MSSELDNVIRKISNDINIKIQNLFDDNGDNSSKSMNGCWVQKKNGKVVVTIGTAKENKKSEYFSKIISPYLDHYESSIIHPPKTDNGYPKNIGQLNGIYFTFGTHLLYITTITHISFDYFLICMTNDRINFNYDWFTDDAKSSRDIVFELIDENMTN